jgi:AraC-like DNA-binding protein
MKMVGREDYPGVIRFVTKTEAESSTTVLQPISEQFEEYSLGANVAFLETSFGDFYREEIRSEAWSISLFNFSIRKPALIYAIADRPMVSICCVLKGNISCELNGYGNLTFQESKYGFYYIPPDVNNEVALAVDDYEAIYFSFSQQFVASFMTQHTSFNDLFVAQRNKTASGQILPFFKVGIEERKILDAIRKCKLKGAARIIYLQARILDLLGCYFQSQEILEINLNQTHDIQLRLRESKLFIDENYHLPLKIESLSKQAGMNLRSYEKGFNELLGFTPKEYLVHIRVEKSAELLRTTNLPVSSIGYLVGFTSSNYFSSVFSNVHHCSPREYRQKWIRKMV